MDLQIQMNQSVLSKIVFLSKGTPSIPAQFLNWTAVPKFRRVFSLVRFYTLLTEITEVEHQDIPFKHRLCSTGTTEELGNVVPYCSHYAVSGQKLLYLFWNKCSGNSYSFSFYLSVQLDFVLLNIAAYSSAICRIQLPLSINNFSLSFC